MELRLQTGTELVLLYVMVVLYSKCFISLNASNCHINRHRALSGPAMACSLSTSQNVLHSPLFVLIVELSVAGWITVCSLNRHVYLENRAVGQLTQAGSS